MGSSGKPDRDCRTCRGSGVDNYTSHEQFVLAGQVPGRRCRCAAWLIKAGAWERGLAYAVSRGTGDAVRSLPDLQRANVDQIRWSNGLPAWARASTPLVVWDTEPYPPAGWEHLPVAVAVDDTIRYADLAAELAKGGMTADHLTDDFVGLVWFQDGLWRETVRRYDTFIGAHTALTLPALCTTVMTAHTPARTR